jgi:hypothetical protein
MHSYGSSLRLKEMKTICNDYRITLDVCWVVRTIVRSCQSTHPVISGENMVLPITDKVAREMELFSSTLTVNPVSSKTAFCDNWDNSNDSESRRFDLACLDDLVREIETK